VKTLPDPATVSILKDAIETGTRLIRLCDQAGATLPACHFQMGVDVLEQWISDQARGPRSPVR